MAAELTFRHTVTGVTMKATIRKMLTTGGKIRMWRAGTVNNWEDLTVDNWDEYIIDMTETPAESYGYVGSWPAALTTVGWYVVDFYQGATIAGVLSGSFLGYWDGTYFVLSGADTREVAATPQTAGDLAALIIVGSAGLGGWVVTFTVTDDSSGATPLQGARVRVTINVEDYSALTDENGVVTFGLGTAGIYTISCSLAGYQFAGGTEDISDDDDFTIEMSTDIFTPSGDPLLTHVVGYVIDGQGVAVAGAEVQFVLTVAPSGKGKLYQGTPILAISGVGGLIDLYLLRSASYRCSTTRMSFTFSTDAETTYELPATVII